MKWKQRLSDSQTILAAVVIVAFIVAWQILLSLPLRSNPRVLFEDSFESPIKVGPENQRSVQNTGAAQFIQDIDDFQDFVKP